MGIVRFILALSVMVDHTRPIFGYSLIGGNISVNSFFIISGFYMAFILNEKYVGENSSYRLFITNRFLRIYPIYWLTLFFTILISWSSFVSYEHSHNMVISLVKNIALFPTIDYAFYQTKTYGGLFVYASWTLGLEFTFYLLAPFIVRKKLPLIILLFIVSILLRYHFTHPMRFPYQLDRFYVTVMIYFVLGILSYKLYRYINKLKINYRYIISVCVIVVFLNVFYKYLPLPFRNLGGHGMLVQWEYYLVMAVSTPFLFIFSRIIKFDRVIGELSYPIYITHALIIEVLGKIHFDMNNNINKILAILITIVTAVLLNKYIAAPIEKYRQARVKTTEDKRGVSTVRVQSQTT